MFSLFFLYLFERLRLRILLAPFVPDIVVTRTLRTACNRRSDPSKRGAHPAGVKKGATTHWPSRKNGRRVKRRARFSPGITPIKTPPRGRGFIKYFTEERQVTGEITFAFEHVRAVTQARWVSPPPPSTRSNCT